MMECKERLAVGLVPASSSSRLYQMSASELIKVPLFLKLDL